MIKAHHFSLIFSNFVNIKKLYNIAIYKVMHNH